MARERTTKTGDARPRDASSVPETQESTGASRSTARTGEGEQQVAGDEGNGPEPHEVNDNLSSDRMQALLEEHRAMGSRP